MSMWCLVDGVGGGGWVEESPTASHRNSPSAIYSPSAQHQPTALAVLGSPMHVSPARVFESAATRCVALIRAAWTVHGLQRGVQSPAMVAPAMRLLSRPLPALL